MSISNRAGKEHILSVGLLLCTSTPMKLALVGIVEDYTDLDIVTYRSKELLREEAENIPVLLKYSCLVDRFRGVKWLIKPILCLESRLMCLENRLSMSRLRSKLLRLYDKL